MVAGIRFQPRRGYRAGRGASAAGTAPHRPPLQAVWLIWQAWYGSALKITLELDDDLMRAVREHARRRGMTLTALVSNALRRALAEPSPVRFQLDLPVTCGN